MKNRLRHQSFWKYKVLNYVMLLILLATATPAVAQDCPSLPWPTTQFEVVHRTGPTDVIPWLESIIQGAVYDDELEADLEAADSAWERIIEDYLHDIAQRFEAAGFGCPNLRTYSVDGEPKYMVYLINFSDDWWHGLGESASGLAYSHLPLIPHMLINKDEFIYAETVIEEKLYGVLAHELFHMIQGAYDLEYDSIRSSNFDRPGQDFVVEGGANGVESYLISKRFPNYWEFEESRRNQLGGFDYKHNLFVDAEGGEDEGPASWASSPYSTGSFWLHMIERYGGLSTMEYFLRQPLEGTGLEDRIRWLERGMSERLYKVFPHFLTELVSYGWSRYRGVPTWLWRHWTLDACRDENDLDRPVPLTLENSENVRPLHSMKQLTGQCVGVKWDIEANPEVMASTALQVEIAAPNKEVFEQLHLGLANASITDGNCWERMAGLSGPERRRISCMLPGDGPPSEQDGKWTKTWTLEPGDYGNEGDATFVVANVGETSWETVETSDLVIRFRFVYHYAVMQIEGDADNNSDDNSSNYEVAPALISNLSDGSFGLSFDPPVARGTCLISLNLSSEQNDGLSVIGLINPPLRPGRYIIQRNGGGHQNLDVLGASLMWNSRSDLGGGNYNRFHGRSGTLDITRVSPTAIIGEFAIRLAKFDDEVEVTGKFSLPPGSPGSGGLFGRFKDDHPCLMLASPESDTGGSGAGRAPSGDPEPGTDHRPPTTPGDDSADNSTGRAPLPDTDPESESNGGSSDTPNGVDLGNVNGENLERAKTKLDFVEGSNAAIRSIAQVVQVRQDGAVASLSSTSFNMTLALPQRELSECGLNQRDPLGFIELLSMTNGERGRMVVYLEGISLQLGVSSGEITLKLEIAGGDITLRGSAPEVESLSPEASGSVLAEVSGASLEGTINQHSFACNNLLDFAFLVTTVH